MSTTGTARDLERFTIDVDQDILDDLRARLNAAAFGADPGDAFEVIVPSLPGFGSTPPTNGKENYLSMADRFHTLMTDVLGYEKFTVGASDHGALVAVSPRRDHDKGMT